MCSTAFFIDLFCRIFTKKTQVIGLFFIIYTKVLI